MRLEGKVAIITGAGSGMGEASAKLFAREGAKIVVDYHVSDYEPKAENCHSCPSGINLCYVSDISSVFNKIY